MTRRAERTWAAGTCGRTVLLALLLAGMMSGAWARPFLVLVYNVENLVDADGKAVFEEYQPARYSRAHVLTKLQNIAEIVAQFEGGKGPDVVMFQEIEVDLTPANAPVNYEAVLPRYAAVRLEDMLGAEFDAEIADLPAEALLAKAFADRGLTGYHVLAAEDVRTAETVRPLAQRNVIFTRFPVKAVRSHPTTDARAIQEVLVEVDGAPLYLFNNHWKSGASDPETEPTRAANARTLRARLSEILGQDPQADVVIAGDFNSQYNQRQRYPQMKLTGMNDVLGSQGNELAVRGAKRDLYNLWYELPAESRGSDTYRGEWGTLIQMMVTRGLYDYRGVQYVDNSFGVAKVPGRNVDEKGLPRRWTFAGPAGAGYSDHFPVYAKFVTVPDNRPDRWIALRNASSEQPVEAATKVDFSKINVAAVALRLEQLPAGTSLRNPANFGRIVLVEGVARGGKRLSVEFAGDVYDVWTFDEALRERLRASYPEGSTIRFYGELGQYRERWQFVIHDPSWVQR